ncbi:vigilin-like [Oppia nitens]|uniref:vigilin-like n=1 Tax=Oppia nitens TaxID=1686743 RepID=UPI0023DA4100|nr:vigilin-like [Oppia nitens]XP_054160892.1 vigilin-like [Oppia nitens]
MNPDPAMAYDGPQFTGQFTTTAAAAVGLTDPNGHVSAAPYYGVASNEPQSSYGQHLIGTTAAVVIGDDYPIAGTSGIVEPLSASVAPAGSTAALPTPSYDDMFPTLPELESRSDGCDPGASNPWAMKATMKVKSSNITQVFRVAPEERRYRELNSRFGEQAEQSKICADIMQKTSAHIEMSVSKDGTLTFLITGKEDTVILAKRMISSELQTQAQAFVAIPKEHHRFILGKNGQKLATLEQNTATKITIPRLNDTSDQIKVVGNKEGIDKAVHEIQLISNEMASRAKESVQIPKIYHPFICGPFNDTLSAIMSETGAKVNIPPPSVNKEEITITGEREAVLQAKDRIMRIFRDREKKCQTVSMEVRKSQHKYIIGPKGHTLNEIFQETGVSVEMPASDSQSETIVLRGEQEKLGPALAVLYQKAHSEVDDEIQVPSWYHKYILGPKGSKFNEISQEFPKVNVSFVANDDKIKMHGPVAEVAKAREVIGQVINEIKSKIIVDELKVESRYHRFIIGKNGVQIKHIREETGAQIHIPSEGTEHVASSDIIRIEGSPQSVAKARQELDIIIKKMIERENEVSKDLMIEHRFHRQMIGAKGESIREIRDKFNQVMIMFPEPNDRSDRVTIRGNRKDVDLCYKHLSQLNKELLSNNHRVEVPIFKQFHKFIIGKEGANIKKIRDETNTRIDLPAEGADSEMIVITGLKPNVELAKERIIAIQNEKADVVTVDIIVPAKIHNYIIGAKGRGIRQISEECGGVLIRFPDQGSGSDKVSISGPKDCVQKAKKLLIDTSNEQQINNHSDEIKIKPELHRYLIGKNGANIRKVRDSTGVRVLFPTAKEESTEDRDIVYISGKKEEVKKAKQMLETMVKDLEKVVEDEMRVDPKYHKHFVAKRGEKLKQIGDDFGGVLISFPRSAQRDSDRVVIKGSKDCVEGAKQRILDIIADLDAQITVEVVIEAKYHRTLMGTRGTRVQSITQEHDVRIKFPERGTNGVAGGPTGDDEVPNGDYNGNAADNVDPTSSPVSPTDKTKKSDIILVTGRPENCESAKAALMALIPISIEVQVPFDMHRFIIGAKGAEVRKLMDAYDVSISVPPPSAASDAIRITGSKENVSRAEKAIGERVLKIEGEQQERQAKSYSDTIHVNPIYHPKIIGKRGAIITKIRDKFKVQIQFPELKRRDSNSGGTNDDENIKDVITIIGYENDVNAAKDEIQKIVRDLEELVHEEVYIDSRVHPRLIGAKGKNIRKIMDKYSVDIRFPRSDGHSPDLVVISGLAENVDECRDELLNLAEEYIDEVVEFVAPSRHTNTERHSNKDSGFVVKGGPWELRGGGGGGGGQAVPDTTDAQEFPSFCSEMSAPAATPVDDSPRNTPWGPRSGRQ